MLSTRGTCYLFGVTLQDTPPGSLSDMCKFALFELPLSKSKRLSVVGFVTITANAENMDLAAKTGQLLPSVQNLGNDIGCEAVESGLRKRWNLEYVFKQGKFPRIFAL